MRESRTYGSVRGALSNERPYRDPIFVNHDLFRSLARPGRVLRRSHRWVGPLGSIVVACMSRQFVPATDTGTAPSILWFATIQCVEGKKDLADLAPKDRFIPAEPVEREVGQIGEAQKATREVGGGINRFWLGAGYGFRSRCDAVRSSIGVGIVRVSPSEHRVDYFS